MCVIVARTIKKQIKSALNSVEKDLRTIVQVIKFKAFLWFCHCLQTHGTCLVVATFYTGHLKRKGVTPRTRCVFYMPPHAAATDCHLVVIYSLMGARWLLVQSRTCVQISLLGGGGASLNRVFLIKSTSNVQAVSWFSISIPGHLGSWEFSHIHVGRPKKTHHMLFVMSN